MISYKIKARLAKDIGKDSFRFEKFEKDFINKENPIKARRAAVDFYKSIIDILGQESNDYSTLKDHIDSIPKKTIQIGGEQHEMLLDRNIGVGIYAVIDEEHLEKNEENEDWLIIGYTTSFDELSVAYHLEREIQIYNQKGWDTESWTKDIKYVDYDNLDKIEKHTVLWTPFDFWKHTNPENKKLSKENESNQKTVIQQIIEGGENRNVEFKSTLKFCIKTGKSQNYIEHSIIKTILAFANTKGGLLIVGVKDNGEILGIDSDIISFKNNTRDSFLNHFDNLIKTSFTEPISALIEYELDVVNNKLIFLVNVEESSKPRYINTKSKGKEFFIRHSASSESLDIEDSMKYIVDKWYS